MLHAAQEVFAEKGYAQATLDEIAERAEFGKGTIYNYFDDGKEGLLFATFDMIYGGLDAIVREAFSASRVRQTSLREAFRTLVHSVFDFLLEREELFLILMKEEVQFMFGDDPEKTAYFQEREHGLVEALIPGLETAIETGEMRSLPPHAVARSIQGNLKGVLMHVAVAHRGEAIAQPKSCTAPPIATPEQAADFLTMMLLNGLATDPEATDSVAS